MKIPTTCLLPAILLSAITLQGSFAYLGGTFTEDFDTLNSDITSDETSRQPIPGTGVVGFQAPVPNLANWQTARLGGSQTTAFEIWAGDTSIGARLHSRGNGASTERALGLLGSSGFWGSFGTGFVNMTSDTFTQVTITYTREIWVVQGTTTPNASEHRLWFAYGVSGNGITDSDFLTSANMTLHAALDAVSVAENTLVNTPSSTNPDRNRDGNSAEWQELVSSTITGLNWLPGETLYIRWNGADGGGNDALLAVDNLSMTALVPEPATVAVFMGLLAGVTLIFRRARRRSA
jgi:hypothetical protein